VVHSSPGISRFGAVAVIKYSNAGLLMALLFCIVEQRVWS